MNCSESVSISNIPAEIVTGIFSRVSVNTIGRCRCVCKTWRDLLTDPCFIDLHLSKSRNCIMLCKSYTFIGPQTLKRLDIDDEPDSHFVHHEPSRTWEHGLGGKLYLVGSVNGLLCLWHDNDDTYILNPILREYVLLPKHKHVSKMKIYARYGFGLCPVTNRYKVMRIFQGYHDPPSESRPFVSECEVYTLGTQAWRSTGHVPFSVDIDRAIFCNGGLHKIKTDIPEAILRFDLETESLHILCSTPPLYKDASDSILSDLITLAEMGGCLCLCDNDVDDRIVIWVMKEYGVKESWTKEIVISHYNTPMWLHYEPLYPIKKFKDGSILMLHRENELITYCPRTKSFKEELVSDIVGNYDAMNYVSSLLSLKNIVSEKVCLF